MAIKKYINTGELAGLTGCLDEEIRDLAKRGVLPAHKTRRGHWRFNVDAVEKFFKIVINPITEDDDNDDSESDVEPFEVAELKQDETRFIFNDEHYDEVIRRICSAKSSIKIMTANFKRFRLKPTERQGDKPSDGTPFIEYLMRKAVDGVSVQIICSKPSKPFEKEKTECYKRMKNPKLFEYKKIEKNHAKIIIVDDKIAYVGSANITRAGLRQDVTSFLNYESGILTTNLELVKSINDFFMMVWNK